MVLAVLSGLCIVAGEIHLARGRAAVITRQDHPLVFWAAAILLSAFAVSLLITGLRGFRSLIRRQREEEQRVLSDFVHRHEEGGRH